MADSNMYDDVAGDLLGWLQSESKWYAEQMRGGSTRSPFAAQTSEQQKLEYYQRQMFQSSPDGTVQYDKPNTEGRSNLMQRLGVDGYTQVYNAVKPQMGKRAPVAAEPEPEVPDYEQG